VKSDVALSGTLFVSAPSQLTDWVLPAKGAFSMCNFNFNVFGTFSFSNVADWGVNEDGTVFVSLCNDSNTVVASLLIPKGIEEVTVTVDLPPFKGEFKVAKENILRQLADCEVGEEDDQKLVDDFLDLVDKMWPNLSFEGDIWVNPVVAFHDEYGHYRQTEIGSGKKMSWEDFLSAYADGSLWGEQRFESVEFNAGDDQAWTDCPLGCLVAPERDNQTIQPITDQQIYVVGKGWWKVRNSDPSYFSWAFSGENSEVQGAIPELSEVPIRLPG